MSLDTPHVAQGPDPLAGMPEIAPDSGNAFLKPLMDGAQYMGDLIIEALDKVCSKVAGLAVNIGAKVGNGTMDMVNNGLGKLSGAAPAMDPHYVLPGKSTSAEPAQDQQRTPGHEYDVSRAVLCQLPSPYTPSKGVARSQGMGMEC